MSGDRRWSSKALAIPGRPRAIRRSWVGWASIADPFWSVEVAAATDVGVTDGLAVRTPVLVEEGAIEAVLEDRANGVDGARFDQNAAPAGGVHARPP